MLETLGLDALIVTCAANIRYLTNHTGSAGTLVMARDGIYLVVDFRYREAVRLLQASTAACPELNVWHVADSYDETLLAGLMETGLARVGFEAAHMSVAKHSWLRQTALARQLQIDLRPTERLIERVRLIKDSAEIATLRDAASRLTAVADAAIRRTRVGVTEREVAAAIEQAIRDAGYERLAFDPIVASGPNSALPHYRAGDRRITTGDLVVLDFGGVLDGYCSDLTRTVSIGPPSSEAQRVYTAVKEAQEAAIAAVRPGVPAAAVDAAARTLLQERGLGDAFGHGTGHGLGLDIHEEPRITRLGSDPLPTELRPGMVFTIEPGAYLAGWGGVRLEDDVLVTETGGEVLTSVDRERWVREI